MKHDWRKCECAYISWSGQRPLEMYQCDACGVARTMDPVPEDYKGPVCGGAYWVWDGREECTGKRLGGPIL